MNNNCTKNKTSFRWSVACHTARDFCQCLSHRGLQFYSKKKKGDKPLQLKTCNTLQMSMHFCFYIRCRGVKGVVKEVWFNTLMMWPMAALNICSVHQMCVCVFVCVLQIWSKSLK